MTSTIQLSELPRELARATGDASPSYRRLYLLVLDGIIPAERDHASGRTWLIRREHLPQIAEAVGLSAPAA